MATQTPIKHIAPRNASFAMDAAAITYLAKNPSALEKFGVAVGENFAANNASFAMDAGIVAPVTTGSNGVPVQFLQNFLQGVVYILQKVRNADKLAPVVTIGDWSDEEIVLTALEHLGAPQLYSDHGGVELTSWNAIYERRSIVRHEIGARMSDLDEERAKKGNLDSMSEKRAAATLSFEILRNEIFFNGYNSGSMKIYGFLNDPNLPAFNTVAQGAGGDTTWASKTVNERCADFLTAAATLRTQSGDNIDPSNDKLIMAVASSVYDLTTEADNGNGVLFSMKSWMKENYPNVEIIPITEFNQADGGDNIFYLYPERVDGSGTDGEETVIQLVPEKLRALRTVPDLKGSTEGFTNALAGCLVKRGYAFYRGTGI